MGHVMHVSFAFEIWNSGGDLRGYSSGGGSSVSNKYLDSCKTFCLGNVKETDGGSDVRSGHGDVRSGGGDVSGGGAVISGGGDVRSGSGDVRSGGCNVRRGSGDVRSSSLDIKSGGGGVRSGSSNIRSVTMMSKKWYDLMERQYSLCVNS